MNTLINALRMLALDIQSDDGVANSVVAQAANELEDLIKKQDELLKALNEIKRKIHGYTDKHICEIATNAIAKAKGEK